MQYVQVIGWSMWFSEYLFLERNWAKDESTLKVQQFIHLPQIYRYMLVPIQHLHFSYNYLSLPILYVSLLFKIHCCCPLNHVGLFLQSGLQRLRDYPQPFWLALFVEGTRFTQAKLLAAQEYAASTGLPIPRNVLIPRTKVGRFYLHVNVLVLVLKK